MVVWRRNVAWVFGIPLTGGRYVLACCPASRGSFPGASLGPSSRPQGSPRGVLGRGFMGMMECCDPAPVLAWGVVAGRIWGGDLSRCWPGGCGASGCPGVDSGGVGESGAVWGRCLLPSGGVLGRVSWLPGRRRAWLLGRVVAGWWWRGPSSGGRTCAVFSRPRPFGVRQPCGRRIAGLPAQRAAVGLFVVVHTAVRSPPDVPGVGVRSGLAIPLFRGGSLRACGRRLRLSTTVASRFLHPCPFSPPPLSP